MNPVVHSCYDPTDELGCSKLIVEIVNRQEVLPADENRLRKESVLSLPVRESSGPIFRGDC